MGRSTGTSNTKRYVRLIVGNIAVLLLLVVVAEGLASYILLAPSLARIVSTNPIAERRHTQYDPDLGWVNEPNVNIPDMYGRNVYLRTNSQRFRNNHDFADVPPQGRQRIICSGDSFTLGYGVDNDHTWCQLLTSLDPRLETINMGQGGYGVDQAYLWFKRDALRFGRQAHILAFITEDFYRMQWSTFSGYGKPVIEIENDQLAVRNVPVARRAYDFPRLTSAALNLRASLRNLRTVELIARISEGAGSAGAAPVATGGNAKTRQVVKKILADLKRLNEERSSALVLVYLPTLHELRGGEPRDWIRFLEQESQALDIPFINAFTAFRALPQERLEGLFIPEGKVDYPGAAGHFNEQGNDLMARVIYEGLKSHLAPGQTPGK